ncbi:MAG: TadE/TadG family type IV pilus assembly protein [Desulfobaccales bacterium]
MGAKEKIRRWGREDGAAMVEFALILMVLLLIILGIIQFGFLFYTKYVITCAFREGARYGSVYKTTATGDRLAPAAYSPSIEQVVRDYVSNLVSNVNDQLTVQVEGDGYATEALGADIVVRVQVNNPYDFLSGLIPALSNITLQAETIMKVE